MKLMPRDPYTRRVARSRAIGALAAAALAVVMLTAISISDSPPGADARSSSGESVATAPPAASQGQ